nr:preprotein translocase subunit SecG [Oceanococcus sp. HetDA_MAG_MS8]
MYTALVAIQVVLAIGIIALVLMQHGKGADAGAAFGSGASGTVFGSRGSANFLSRSTGILAAFFFVVSLVLAVIVARGQAGTTSVVDSLAAPAQQSVAPETAEDEPAAQPVAPSEGAPE